MISSGSTASSSSLSNNATSSASASPANTITSSQPTSSNSSLVSSSSAHSLGASSGFRIPSRPNHRVSIGGIPSAQPFISRASGVAAPSGGHHGAFPIHQFRVSGGSSLSTNATTSAPNEWPSGVAHGTSINTITKVPPPIGYNADGPIFGVNETLPNDYASGVLSLSYGMGNCSMSPGSDGYNAKSCSCVNRIGGWYHQYATATVTTTSCQSTYDALVATSAQQLGCFPQTITELSQQYTAPADCCDKCGIVGSGVRLLYWPNKTGTPASISGAAINHANVTAPPVAAASSGIVSDGMTFVSPSVYVVYTSIHATASCVARVNSQIPLGPMHTLVTRAYAPQALSTAICQADNLGAGLAYCVTPVGQAPQEGDCFQGINVGWAPINYDELANPPPDSVIYERKRSCFPAQTGSMDPNFLRSIFLNPQLAFPSDVTDIDPMWKTWGGNTCTAVNLGVGDPPSTLGQATALVPGALVAPAPAPEQGQGGYVSGCLKCLVGPGLHSSAAALVPTMVALGGLKPTAEPAVTGQAPASPIAQATSAPVFQHIPGATSAPAQVNSALPAQGASNSDPPVNDPIQASPQKPSGVPINAVSEAQPAPAPVPTAPAAITLQPQTTPPTQAVVPQNKPGVGQAINGALQNQPANVPVNNPASADTVPLVAAIPSVSVGGQPVFQHPNSNIVVAGSTILPGSTAQIAGHSVSNGVNSVVVDGNTRQIPSMTAAAAPPLPTVAGQTIQHQGSNLVVAGQTIAPGQQGSVAGHAIVNNGNAVVVDGSSQALQPTPAPAALPSINDQPIQTAPNGNLVVAGSTVAPGSQAVIQGHTLANQGSNFVLDGSTGSSQPSSAPQNLPIVDGQPVQKQQDGNLVIGGSITVPPGVHTNIAGQQISNGPSQIEVNGQAFAAVPAQTAAPLITDGGIVHVTNGDLEVGSQTLAPGSQATVDGQVVSYPNPSQVVIDGATHSLAAISSAQPLVIAGQTLSRAPNGGVVVAGSTVAADGIATVSGHTFSLLGSSSIVDDGQTYSIPATTNAYLVQPNVPASNFAALPTGAMTLANGLVVTPEVGLAPGANPTYRLPDGDQISAGGSAAVVSGTTYSALPSGAGFLVNGKSTLAFPMVTAGSMPTASAAIYTVGGQVFTANPTGFDIGSMTVAPGGSAVTISGTVVSLDKSDHLRIGTSTMDLSSEYAIPTNDVVSIGGTAVTAAPTGFVLDGKTVSPGGKAVTVHGTVVSLDKQSHLKIGSSTVLLTSAASATTTSSGSAASGVATPVGSAGAPSALPTNGDGVHSGGIKVVSTCGRNTILCGLGFLGVLLNL